MEAVCRGGAGAECAAHALTAALHSLHLYCATISAALMCCCSSHNKRYRCTKHWRGQNVRGVASLVLGVVWCCGAAAACLRPTDTVALVAGLLAPAAWLAAAAFHVALWRRRTTAPILYLAIYWLLASAASAATLYELLADPALSSAHLQIYIQGLAALLALLISVVDCLCFYDEITKRYENSPKSPAESTNVPYKYNDTHFYSKISFFWLNPLLHKGYEAPLEENDFGDIPENEKTKKDYYEFLKIFSKHEETKASAKGSSIWKCYLRKIWPNFYIAGILKLCGDMIGVVPPLGLAGIIQHIDKSNQTVMPFEASSNVTINEFFNNGYVMLCIVVLALICQAFLSQNSTHLVTVEGMRLKAALQAMVYNKCMRLAPWTSTETNIDEDSPLLPNPEESANTRTGLLTNLVSQDTYNIMSCVWICHYIWAIPLKVAVILYLLYKKLGMSALIGTAAGVFIIMPLQFFIGKKLSDNSKEASKRTDHRISKMVEILQGITVIKLYVWEDLFKEKILQLREVELKLLNKDSIYWSFLTFTTQISTILITVITFTTYYFIGTSGGLTAVNVFAGLAFFNQLTVPLLILPVTVLMVIQAVVSTRRIRDFLELPEANNVTAEDNDDDQRKPVKFDESISENSPDEETSFWDKDDENIILNDGENNDQFSDDEVFQSTPETEFLVRFRNAAFTWGMRNDSLLEIEDLDIPKGKLIMIVGSTGSGKTSFLSAVLGEMYIERGDVSFNGSCPLWYSGQPPWLLEGSVRDNIVMDNPWCQRRYSRVLRATGLNPDLQILPEGDATRLGSFGAPLSGGQRIRVCLARALYSPARLLALDEPLGALDAPLARHVVARALLPAARAGRTVLLATNRLELMHYADLVLVMEDGRVCGFGRAGAGGGADCAVSRWAQLAGEARAAAARAGAGPPGGTARERTRLVRALSRQKFQRCTASADNVLDISEACGSHLLAEVGTRAGGSWRRATLHPRPALARQFSSPPTDLTSAKWRRDVRRAVSADDSNATLKREASLLRRLLRPKTRTLRSLRRLISTDSDAPIEEHQANNGVTEENGLESAYTSLTSNGEDVNPGITGVVAEIHKHDTPEPIDEWRIWCEYLRACGWWGAAYAAAACAAQALAVAADFWLSQLTASGPLDDQRLWSGVTTYAAVCAAGGAAACCAQGAGAASGARGRRAMHERLLHAALRAPLSHHHATPPGHTLHRFSADILVVDKKLPTAITRWMQLALLCGAAMLVNVALSPWSALALLPAVICYLVLQSVYLCNARELQRAEALSAGSVVTACVEACAGGATVRAGRMQPRMRAAFLRRLDDNHNALLLLNAANRWLGLGLDVVGAACVCGALGVALLGGAAAAGLAGAQALLLPAYLAHLAKGRADLDQQLAALERLHHDSNVPQEDYREHCPIPPGWQRNGKIEFENVSIQHEPGSPPILNNINISVNPGEKLAVCGRSGSGKSTLLLSCVDATSLTSGRILLDGYDVTKVPLRMLRHRVVVLPQDPAMFSGTVRENMDPLAVHTDEEIWLCLKAVGLKDFVTAHPAGLECSVERGRGGWSVGRVARLCGARAALHAPAAAALLLDEPAAALDASAERALLAALAARAPGTTLLTVAHRVSSVRGYERAVVLDEGRVAEQGAVSSLLARPTTRLARMLAAANTLR